MSQDEDYKLCILKVLIEWQAVQTLIRWFLLGAVLFSSSLFALTFLSKDLG